MRGQQASSRPRPTAIGPLESTIRPRPRPRAGESLMKHNVLLRITSLLSILLLTLHVTDDIVRGISKAEPANTALVVLVIWLYGTLVLAETRLGHVIMFLIGFFAAAMPVMHMMGAHYPEIAASTGGFFFVWTLWALGGIGGVTMILAVQGLWSLRRQRPRAQDGATGVQ